MRYQLFEWCAWPPGSSARHFQNATRSGIVGAVALSVLASGRLAQQPVALEKRATTSVQAGVFAAVVAYAHDSLLHGRVVVVGVDPRPMNTHKPHDVVPIAQLHGDVVMAAMNQTGVSRALTADWATRCAASGAPACFEGTSTLNAYMTFAPPIINGNAATDSADFATTIKGEKPSGATSRYVFSLIKNGSIWQVTAAKRISGS